MHGGRSGPENHYRAHWDAGIREVEKAGRPRHEDSCANGTKRSTLHKQQTRTKKKNINI